MNTVTKFAIPVLLALCPLAQSANQPVADGRVLLWSAYVQARETNDRARTEIVRLDAEIAKNVESMRRSETIIGVAMQRSNAEARKAEAIARQALAKATEAKRANELARKKWEVAKAQSEAMNAAIRGMHEPGAGATAGVRGILTARSGKVRVMKADGSEATATNAFLEKGDRLQVEIGRAELKLLDGRGDVIIGPNSELALAEDTPEEQILEQVGGKLHVSVEKAGEFLRRMTAWFGEFGEDLRTVAGTDMAEIEKALMDVNRRLEMRLRHGRKTLAAGAVRGTTFVSETDKKGGFIVTVLDGAVDIRIPGADTDVLLSQGEKAIIAADGVIERKKADPLVQWWEP